MRRPAEAEPPAPEELAAWTIEAELELAVAKVCANEASLTASFQDCALIWQVVSGRARTPEARLAWLQSHSRRVLGDRECSEHRNCWWTRNLQANDVQPEGWPAEWTWRPEQWARLRRWSAQLVSGQRRHRPCEGTPVTWGGRMDRPQAAERGLVPLQCAGTENDGYAVLGAQ